MDSLVLAMVTPSYKALVESTQSLRGPLEETVDAKKGEIVEVQKKITKELSGMLQCSPLNCILTISSALLG